MPEIPSNSMDQNEFKLYPEDDYLVGDGDQSYSDQRYPMTYANDIHNIIDNQSMNYYEDENNDEDNYDDNNQTPTSSLKRKLSSSQQLDAQSNNNSSNLKKRFVWPDSLHKDFISAVFDIGLRYAVAREVSKIVSTTSNSSTNQPVVTPDTNPSQDQYKSIIQKLRLFRDPRIIPRKSFYEKERDEEELAAFGKNQSSNNLNDSNQSAASNAKVDPRTLEAKDSNEELIKRTEQEYLNSISQLHSKLEKIKKMLTIQEKFKSTFERNYAEQTKKLSELTRLLAPTMNPTRGPSGLGEVNSLFSNDSQPTTNPSSLANYLAANSNLPITDSRELMTEFKGNMEMHHYFMQFREERQQMHGAQLLNNNDPFHQSIIGNETQIYNEPTPSISKSNTLNQTTNDNNSTTNDPSNNGNSNNGNSNNNTFPTNNTNITEWDPDHEDFENLFCFLYN